MRNFYETGCDYIVNKWPLNDVLLQHAEIADEDLTQEKTFSSVKYFVDRFPCIVEGCDFDSDNLEEEFASFQVETLTVSESTISDNF